MMFIGVDYHPRRDVNVLWGTLNAAAGYLLVSHVGEFHIRHIPDALVLGAGGLLMAVMLSRAFGRLASLEKPHYPESGARARALQAAETSLNLSLLPSIFVSLQ